MKRLYLDNVQILTNTQMTERRSRCDFESVKFYVNRLPNDVYIQDRSGLITRLQVRNDSVAFAADSLFICEQLQCVPEVIDNYVTQARQTSDAMRQHMHKVVLKNWAAVPPVRARYSVEALCSLSLSVLQENDGVVYLEEHDLVVMYGLSQSEMSKINHPYSKTGYAKSSYDQVKEGNNYLRKGDFTFNIRIVDNANVFGSRWILINEETFCIVAGKDHRSTDGIYITYSKNLLGDDGPQRMMTTRYDFNDGGNLPYYKLYESQQEALLDRRSNQVTEAQVKIHELESKASAAENALRKVQQERENIEREALHRRHRHEQEMEKLRKDHEKMQNEHELYLRKQIGETLSVSRKNTMEVIKYVPAVITAIACLSSMFKKK